MRFASLGSGSSGNALLVESGHTRLMLDCGFNLKETVARLARSGIDPEDLAGIVVTHEHSDHIGGVGRLARRFQLPVWMTWGTWRMAEQQLDGVDVHFVESNVVFAIDDLELLPFTVPHDAREPVQFVFHDGRVKLGVLTDTGRTTPHIEQALSGMDALVLECNHDRQMLLQGPYPAALKARVGGAFGHLDNIAAAAILSVVRHDRLQHVVAAHISQQNNTSELARAALADVMGCAPDGVIAADQENGFDWLTL